MAHPRVVLDRLVLVNFSFRLPVRRCLGIAARGVLKRRLPLFVDTLEYFGVHGAHNPNRCSVKRTKGCWRKVGQIHCVRCTPPSASTPSGNTCAMHTVEM